MSSRILLAMASGSIPMPQDTAPAAITAAVMISVRRTRMLVRRDALIVPDEQGWEAAEAAEVRGGCPPRSVAVGRGSLALAGRGSAEPLRRPRPSTLRLHLTVPRLGARHERIQ